MKATAGKLVSIRYSAKNDSGVVVDSSEGGTLDYVHGSGRLFPALERLIEGKEAGDRLCATLEPSDAYGEHVDGLTAILDRCDFPSGCQIKVGATFHAQTETGPRTLRVTRVEGDEVTVDANHALAGVRLHFDIEVVSVSDAGAWQEEDCSSCAPSCSAGSGGCQGCASCCYV